MVVSLAIICLFALFLIVRTNSSTSEHDAMVVYKDALLSCEDKNALLVERLEKYERIFNVTHFNPDYDDVSIVELLFLNLREKLIKLVPDTDEACKFDWIIGECHPKCECEFKPKLGDYSPSRACRLRGKGEAKISSEVANSTCDPNAKSTPWAVKVAKTVQREVMVTGTKLVQKMKEEAIVGRRIIAAKAAELHHKIITHAPASDKECKWDPLRFRCSPVENCLFEYQYGDYSLDRACRLRVDDDDDANGYDENNDDNNNKNNNKDNSDINDYNDTSTVDGTGILERDDKKKSSNDEEDEGREEGSSAEGESL